MAGAAPGPLLQRSPLSDELRARFEDEGKGRFFHRLRGLSRRRREDPDLAAYVATLGGDDRWLAEGILAHGPESRWPLRLQLERELKGWAGTGDPETILRLLRRLEGSAAGDATLRAALERTLASAPDETREAALWLLENQAARDMSEDEAQRWLRDNGVPFRPLPANATDFHPAIEVDFSRARTGVELYYMEDRPHARHAVKPRLAVGLVRFMRFLSANEVRILHHAGVSGGTHSQEGYAIDVRGFTFRNGVHIHLSGDPAESAWHDSTSVLPTAESPRQFMLRVGGWLAATDFGQVIGPGIGTGGHYDHFHVQVPPGREHRGFVHEPGPEAEGTLGRRRREPAAPPPGEARFDGRERARAVLARSPLSDRVAAVRAAGRSKGEVFAILRGRQGGGDAEALEILREMYAEGTDDRWLAETLLRHGPEPLWPAAEVAERARRSRRWGRGPGETPEAGGIRAELPFPPESGASSAQPVVAYFFPGETERRALIIGGVHGSEVQGARIVESLRGELERMCRAGRPPHFTTILVPVLNARTHDPALREQRQRYIPRTPTDAPSDETEARGIEPNRTFPVPGEDYADARRRVAAGGPELVYTPPPGGREPRRTGHEATEMIPETRALVHLIERFRPERIASVHAHSIGPTAAGRRGDDPGVFVDPARERGPGGALREQAGSRALGERMLGEGRRRAGGLPPAVRGGRTDPFLGNVGGETTYDPDASHPRGYSLGDWAPVPTATRPGITTITVEVPQYGGSVPADARQRVEDLHRDLLRDIFLGPDARPADSAAPARPEAPAAPADR